MSTPVLPPESCPVCGNDQIQTTRAFLGNDTDRVFQCGARWAVLEGGSTWITPCQYAMKAVILLMRQITSMASITTRQRSIIDALLREKEGQANGG